MDLRDLDLEQIAERYRRTFARENHDRPLVWLSYAQPQHPPALPTPPTIRERWFNFEWRLESFENHLEGTGFLLEGFPSFHCNLGPDILASCMGSELEFAETTSWAIPRVKDWRETPPLRFHHEGFYWQQMARFLSLSAEWGKGKWLTASGDLHTNGDGLAALRGPQNLLLDLLDNPEEILRRLAECHAVYSQVLQAHFDILLPASGGFSSSWCTAALKGRFATIQNDFSCMIGPAHFRDFFLPYVEKESALLDACVYHLDGPGALPHLAPICSVPTVHLIQWVPGAGNKPPAQWPELLRQIQSLGKGLWLYGTPEEQLNMMRFLKPEGCMYNVWVKDRQEAESFLQTARSIWNQRPWENESF